MDRTATNANVQFSGAQTFVLAPAIIESDQCYGRTKRIALWICAKPSHRGRHVVHPPVIDLRTVAAKSMDVHPDGCPHANIGAALLHNGIGGPLRVIFPRSLLEKIMSRF